MTEDYLLGVILFAPFVGAAVLATPWVSNRHPLLVRQLAAFFAGISFFASFYLLLAFDWQKGGYQFQQKYIWSERSEEHTSELQSPCNLVCRLLLEKKKLLPNYIPTTIEYQLAPITP